MVFSDTTRSRFRTAARMLRRLGWIVLAFVAVQPFCSTARVTAQRAALLDQFQSQRNSRVIAMIHRQETVSLLGVPVSSFIDIEDSEAVLRAIRLTPPNQPIDLILYTPGGLVLAAEQIAHALLNHSGKITVFVPHYAMSGGTLLALTADQIVMDPNAVLGPVDPQIDDMPAASIVKVVSAKPLAQISDDMLVRADVAQKARMQTVRFVEQVLLKRMPKERAAALATILSEGRWTHDAPILVEAARELGLPVSTDMPSLIYDLMDLYPQADALRPSVLYVPLTKRNGGASRPAPAPLAGTDQ
jgi:ClpP class serine protease